LNNFGGFFGWSGGENLVLGILWGGHDTTPSIWGELSGQRKNRWKWIVNSFPEKTLFWFTPSLFHLISGWLGGLVWTSRTSSNAMAKIIFKRNWKHSLILWILNRLLLRPTHTRDNKLPIHAGWVVTRQVEEHKKKTFTWKKTTGQSHLCVSKKCLAIFVQRVELNK
jgi:hypothetical protein